MTFRLQVDSCGPSELSALIKILLGGTPVSCSNRQLWIQAVQDSFDDAPLWVPCRKLLQLVWEAAPQVGCRVYLVNPDGSHHSRDLVAMCRGLAPLPNGGVHVHIRPQKTSISSLSLDDPQLVNIDCTGLGGHDLGGAKDYDICIRTDKHSQSIYGPSVTPLESPGRDGTRHVSLVALGGSKAMHEFLVLHYMATDSAEECAGFRRALALHMYNKCHVAPSHRRFAHPSWIAGIKLMLDLLLGARKHRYLRSRPFDHLPAKVSVRGFSAGSYSGICLLHLLWNMPHVQVDGILGGIALPPLLLHGIQPDRGDRLMVIHLTTDRLCQWDPRDETLSSLPCKYCIVDRSTIELREHFGEHSYGHWIDLNMPHGRFPLWQLLRQYPEVAHPQCRDIAPLRLVSWVSCEVPARVQQVLHQLMILFGEVAPVSSNEVLEIGRQQLGVTASGELTWDMIRDALIREVTFGGTTCPTEEVCCLMAAFLQRLPLPRLVHFLDMILPQMVQVQSPCHSGRRRFASSYRVTEHLAEGEIVVEYPLNVVKLYWSRSGIMHVTIAWDHKPLLLLATALLPNRTTGTPTSRGKASISFGSTFRRFVLTLRGYLNSWLVLTAVLPWTGALGLPYGEVHHLQGSESDFRHSMVFQNIYHIGDTKSAQELEVFLRMPPERPRLCCGIQCTDSLHPNGPRQRQKLFTAALKLLWFAIGIETVRCENEAQRALHAALLPLLRLEDGQRPGYFERYCASLV